MLRVGLEAEGVFGFLLGAVGDVQDAGQSARGSAAVRAWRQRSGDAVGSGDRGWEVADIPARARPRISANTSTTTMRASESRSSHRVSPLTASRQGWLDATGPGVLASFGGWPTVAPA